MKNTLVVSALIALLVSGIIAFIVPRTVDVAQLGAVSGPDIMSPYFSFGGVRFWGARTDALAPATTTVCALQSPAATSTLVSADIRFTVSSTTATLVTAAKATSAFATTTAFGQTALAANAQGTINIASSTAATSLDGIGVFAPNTYLVVGMQGGIGTFSPSGTCQAVWRQN